MKRLLHCTLFIVILLSSVIILSGCADTPASEGDSGSASPPSSSSSDSPENGSDPASGTGGETTVSDPPTAVMGIHSDTPTEATPYLPTALMYHLVLEEPYSECSDIFLRPSEFEDQLKALNEAGAEYLFADEFAYSSRKCVVLTFDDGYEDNYTNMFPLLKKYNAKATIFVVASYINCPGYLSSAQIKEMDESGLVRFGSHTLSHSNLKDISPDRYTTEFSESKSLLSEIVGKPVDSISYPNGGFNDAISSAASEFYKYGYTTSKRTTRKTNLMQIPRMGVPRGMSGAELLKRLEWKK